MFRFKCLHEKLFSLILVELLKSVMIASVVLFLISAFLAPLAANESSPTCMGRVIKKGCYYDPGSTSKTDNRTFPILLPSYREMAYYDWSDGWDDYLHDLTCHCAKQAKKSGFRFFGLQFYKECWAGELPSNFFSSVSKVNNNKDKCWGVRPSFQECDDSVSTACVGTNSYNYIYEIVQEETENNICEQQLPCQHGECIPEGDSYSCSCDADYEGSNCEKLIDDCADSPCVNGECIDGVNSYECRCIPGYEGQKCEKNINDCAESPCINGECVDSVNSYECKCTPGYEGKNCEKNIDDCAGSPCINGECIDGVNSYECTCKPGYEGESCEKNTDDCVGNKCVHGKCVDDVNSYQCQCNYGYEGDNCDKEIMEPSSCSNINWWKSFDKKGLSTCGKKNLYITGFFRNTPKNNDPIYLLEEAKCCSAMPLLSSKSGECENADWWKSLDKNNRWSLCPSGYFLNGLYRNSGKKLHQIEEGYCCRPKNHANWYGNCYDENVGKDFDKKGLSSCSKTGYYIVGVYRGSGDWLNNIDRFRCCQMTSVECLTADWGKSFDEKGWSTCGKENVFITGFYRSGKGLFWADQIYRLEKAKCCSASARYRGEVGSCINQNWWSTLDKKRTWAKCPVGYFLNGLYRNDGEDLHKIEEGKCCRPKNHPAKYGRCYDENIKDSFDKKGWSSCTQHGYYVVGIYRHDGDSLDDIDKLKCCKMWAA